MNQVAGGQQGQKTHSRSWNAMLKREAAQCMSSTDLERLSAEDSLLIVSWVYLFTFFLFFCFFDERLFWVRSTCTDSLFLECVCFKNGKFSDGVDSWDGLLSLTIPNTTYPTEKWPHVVMILTATVIVSSVTYGEVILLLLSLLLFQHPWMYKCARAHTHKPKPFKQVLTQVCRSFTCHAPVILFKLTKRFGRRTKKLFTSTDNCRWSDDNLFTEKSFSQKLELFYINFFFDIWCINALRQIYVHCMWTHTHTNGKKNSMKISVLELKT